jgi:ankyrin repeat protein
VRLPDNPALYQAMNYENHQNDTKTMLHWAAENDRYSVAENLLAIEDPNSKDGGGKAPLHLAAKKGSESVVTFLLARGGDQTAEDNSGLMPLHHAIEGGSEAVVKLLSKFSELKLPISPSWYLCFMKQHPTDQFKWQSGY